MSASSKIIQAAAGNVAGGAVEPVGIDFDGTNDNLFRSTDLVGNSDGKTFTFSAWVYPTDPSDITTHYIYAGDGTGSNAAFPSLRVNLTSGNLLAFLAENQAGTRILQTSSVHDLAWNTWNHVLISIDLANASNRYVYINDVAQSVTYSTYTNDDIGFSSAQHAIGSLNVGGSSKGRLAGVYLDYTYRNLSVEANRRDFIDENGLYVTPPTSGIISVPMDDPADPGRNDGTGGDFTLNGVVAQSGRGPNQYNAAASTFDGSADRLSLSSLSGAADGKQLTIAFWLNAKEQNNVIFDTDVGRFRIELTGNGQIDFKFRGATDAYFIDGSAGGYSGVILNEWTHFAISFDLTDTGKRHFLLDGVEQNPTYSAYNSVDMAFTEPNYSIGGRANNTEYCECILSDFFLDDTYIDLSANNPFYDTETGKPKFLGATGEIPTGSAPLIYLPLRADDAGKNLGTGGDFTVNSGPYVGARGPSEYWASAGNFVRSSSQYLARGGALTGISDGKIFSAAFAIKPVSTAGSTFSVLSNEVTGAGRGMHIRQSGSQLSIRFTETAVGAVITLDGETAVDTFTAGQWSTVLIAIDMSDTNKRYMYVDGALPSVTWSNYTDQNLRFVGSDTFVGAIDGGGDAFDGNIGFLWFNTEYIDFSQEANRLKFFDAFNNPVDLGEDGSTPTGSQPLIYLNEGFHLGTNLGSGGNFTPSGTPTDGGYVNG